MSDRRIKKQDLLASLPEPWPEDVLPEIDRRITRSDRALVVLDDDPTGTQTVHDVPVLIRWSVESLRAELLGDSPAVYLLTNSRSLPRSEARELNRAIGHDLVEATSETDQDFAVVSRSDSTLRGHFPEEVVSLVEALGQDFDAWLLVPFFLEGGRYTIHDTHYVAEGEWLIPAARTEYAKDAAFGYSASNLREWVAEKTNGQVPADSVASISIEDIRCGGPQRVKDALSALTDGTVCVVNAASRHDLEVFVAGLLTAESRGRRFLYRTAASFVPVRSGISSQPLLTPADLDLSRLGAGLFVVGSYVPKTSRQLRALLAETETRGIRIGVEALLNDARRQDEIVRVARQAVRSLESGEDVAMYTSRRLVVGVDAEDTLTIGKRISEGIGAIMQAISTRPRYVVSKGGITSSVVAAQGMNVRRASVLGQILPGVPVWRLGAKGRYPGLVYVVFPGNVGDSQALVRIARSLKWPNQSADKIKGA